MKCTKLSTVVFDEPLKGKEEKLKESKCLFGNSHLFPFLRFTALMGFSISYICIRAIENDDRWYCVPKSLYLFHDHQDDPLEI